jgi:hypothetical protein
MKPPGKSPGFWWYPADFERDVQMLSLTAQGLWMRILGWMHENEAHRGFLELPTGAPMLTDDIAAKVGKPLKEVNVALQSLERIGVFSRDDRGCIYCRRMIRETHISEVRKAAANERYRRERSVVCKDFAHAKPHANVMQKSPVTASVSDTDSDISSTAAKPPERTAAVESLDQIRQWLHEYVQGKHLSWPIPDQAICRKVLAVCRGDLERLHELLIALYEQGRTPDRSYAWFVAVIQGEFEGQKHGNSTAA